MATSLRQLIRILGTFKGEGNFAENTHTIDYTLDVTFTEGTDVGEIDRIFSDERSRDDIATYSDQFYYTGASASTTDVGYGADVDAVGQSLVSSGISDGGVAVFSIENTSTDARVRSIFNEVDDEGFEGLFSTSTNSASYYVYPLGFLGMHTTNGGWETNDGSCDFLGSYVGSFTELVDYSCKVIVAGRSS